MKQIEFNNQKNTVTLREQFQNLFNEDFTTAQRISFLYVILDSLNPKTYKKDNNLQELIEDIDKEKSILFEDIKEYMFFDGLEFLALTPSVKESLIEYDLYCDILAKVDSDIPSFRFNTAFDNLYKIQHSSTIFIKEQNRTIQKIAFVYNNKDLFTFEVSQRLDIIRNYFFEVSGVQIYGRIFTYQFSKIDAVKFLKSRLEKINNHETKRNFDFVIRILEEE